MDMILDEKEAAEQAINNGFIDEKKPIETIVILIKYYYSVGEDKSQIRDEIENYMKTYYKDFNPVNWQDILDKLVKNYAKERYNLVNVKSVNITESEINKILELDNIKLEKLAFVLLVYAKILNQVNEKNDNWVNKECNTIFKTAMIADTGRQQKLMINKLYEKEYITLPLMVNKTSIKVDYLNENDKVIMVIDDFRNFVLQYLEYKGEELKRCENCGCRIKPKSKNGKYCNKCSKDIKKEQDKIADKKYKEKKKREKA